LLIEFVNPRPTTKTVIPPAVELVLGVICETSTSRFPKKKILGELTRP
jgi:hypothetical protein